MVEQRTLQGDDAQLFSVFHAELQRTVRRVVNTSAANIEDACADAWLALLRYDPERRPSIRGWLVVVAIREAVRRDRLDRRHRPFVEDLDDDRGGSWPRPSPPSPRRTTRRSTRTRRSSGWSR